jgi:predicted enzyme related to lactoylglutathione lyase
MKFTGILMASEDPKRLKDYYSKLFDAPGFDDENGFFGWDFGGGWIVIGPHDKIKGKNQSPARIMWNLETADVKSDFDTLVAKGATVVAEPYSPGDDMLIATFSDPDDNYFQLMSPMPA